MLSAPWAYPKLEYFFLVAGYGSGKSFTIACMILRLAWEYRGKSVVIGVGADTITRLRKTVLAELFKLCVSYGTKYSYDGGQNILSIGRVKFMMINTSLPEEIYGYSYSAFLCDELDELPQDKALAAFNAIQERTRVTFPDGRIPWSAFFTTAQGYRATYQIVTEMAENGTPALLLRGRTADNKSLPKSYVERLYSIYNEVERMVFLEGQFANLTTGRVYYGYDEEKNRLKQVPFAIEPNDLIRIGQDFNAGYSRGTAIIKRDGVLHVCQLFDFKEIGQAPKMIRTAFPVHNVEWYPDASGWEVVVGYSKEIRAHGIECRVGTINPSVIDRIFFVNKLFEMGKLVLWANCGPLSMALKVRQFNDRGDPEKGKGPTAPDHYCFAAGTKVTTEDGEVPIDLILPGQKVRTRRGFRTVTASGMTGIREVQTYRIDGHDLRCTPDHPIWTGSGFKAASQLAPGSQPATVPVYNLTVEREHEFFANGVLVRNCDSLEYVVWRIVCRDQEFLDLWDASRSGRRVITDRVVA